MLSAKTYQLIAKGSSTTIGFYRWMAISPDQQHLISVGDVGISSYSSAVEFRSLTDGKLLATIPISSDQIARSAAISPDGQYLAVGMSSDKKRDVKVWRIKPVPPVEKK